MKRLLPLAILGAVFCGVVAFRPIMFHSPRASVCGTGTFQAELRDSIKHLIVIADSVFPGGLESLEIPRISPDSVDMVSRDSLCDVAGNAINRDERVPSSTSRTVFLARLGSRYWAQDTAMRKGEWGVAYILDSTLTTVKIRLAR